MKFLFAVAMAAVASVAVANDDAAADGYDTKYDDFNLEELRQNDAQFQEYVQCFLKKGTCTPEGQFFVDVFADALDTKCGKCNEKQRELIKNVIIAVHEKSPDDFEAFKKEYDPENKHEEIFKHILGTA